MKYTTTVAALGAIATASTINDKPLMTRQDNSEDYIRSVCFPDQSDPVPPCQAIINIESTCQPNGTSPIDYVAHQQCMCNGGFFPNWKGCQQCQYVHGSRSEAVVSAFNAIISSASVQLCTGTPTAVFADIFSTISEGAPQTAAGVATTVSDQYPSQTAVSLYYTASGNQGPGVITGAAVSATKAAGEEVSTSAGVASAAVTADASVSASTSGVTVAGSGSRSSSVAGSTTLRSQSTSAVGGQASSTSASAASSQTGAGGSVVVGQGGVIAMMAGAFMLL